MKKKPVRKVIKHSTATSKIARKKYNRGALGAGMAYAILAMLVIVAAGTTMIGSIIPTGKGESGMPVAVMTHSPNGAKSNLQLETFPGATYTPTPTPTATPTVTPPPPPPASGGGSGGSNGGGGGGSSSPGRGGGSGGGGGGSSGGPGIGYSPIENIGAFLLALTGNSQ